MNIANVTTKVQLDALYKQSVLTWVGLSTDEENLKAVIDWLNQNGAIIENEKPIIHIIKGELMNKVYGLTGNNAYDDINIVSVTNIKLTAIMMARFKVGARWFDDVVDNNIRRQGEM